MSAFPGAYARNFPVMRSTPLLRPVGRAPRTALLQLAATQFDVLLTVDRNLEYQQSFLGLTIAVIVVDVPSNDIAVLRPLMPAVLKALPNSKPGTVTHVHG